jgi:hypothetical protein
MSFATLTLKTEFEKIENLFKKFFKSEPKWADIAITDLAFLASVINAIDSAISDAQTDASAVLSSAKKDLVLAIKFIQAGDTTQNVMDILTSLISNLQGLLTLSSVINNSKIADITSYVTGAVNEIQAILNALKTT